MVEAAGGRDITLAGGAWDRVCCVQPTREGVSGRIGHAETKFDAEDNRGSFPRFSPEALKANRPLAVVIADFAANKRGDGCADCSGVAAGAEALDCADPGYYEIERVEENIGAASIELTPEDLSELDAATATIKVHGDRYTEASEKMTNR